jgi:hypothetical protein
VNQCKRIIAVICFVLQGGVLFAQGDSLRLISTFGKFNDAVSISAAREEFIFVSDLSTNKIHKYEPNGTELASFGGSGLGENELNQPYSIDATNGLDVLVADYQNNRIKRLDINLNYILSFDFLSYNLTAESSKKIFNPSGVATLSSGEVFILCDATNYKAAKINDYNDVTILFGSSAIGTDKLENPAKIIKGNKLDVWILDKGSNEILNFDSFGVFRAKLKPKFKGGIISIAYYNDVLLILHKSELVTYDLKKGQYSKIYRYPYIKDTRDITVLDKNTILILTKSKIFKYSFQFQ